VDIDIPEIEMALIQKWAEQDSVTIRSIVRQMIQYTKFIRGIESDKSLNLLVGKDGKYERVRFE
jgi:hypothetical protein